MVINHFNNHSHIYKSSDVFVLFKFQFARMAARESSTVDSSKDGSKRTVAGLRSLEQLQTAVIHDEGKVTGTFMDQVKLEAVLEYVFLLRVFEV